MSKRMLIDATHPEETRVAVVDGTRLEEFDFEIASRRQIKSNIYLAKVTRVEPSLQAAFVEYGGNRHGFLPFPEIHPDYYRIPVGDRDVFEDDEPPEPRRRSRRDDRPRGGRRADGDRSQEPAGEKRPDEGSAPEHAAFEDHAEGAADEHGHDEHSHDEHAHDAHGGDEHGRDEHGRDDRFNDARVDDEAEHREASRDEPAEDASDDEAGSDDTGDDEPDGEPPESISAAAASDPYITETVGEETPPAESEAAPVEIATDHAETSEQVEHAEGPAAVPGTAEGEVVPAESVEILGGDEVEEQQRRRRAQMPRYKIQEVIKRRQIMLVQVSKEERGNKGAAVTTFLSLPGRYCVLMPNTSRGGGVSRKIANPADRKRMKDLISDLEVPEGMSVILRTAGVERSKAEIKRDLEYLLRLWEQIRTLTLESTAPALIYEEGNLVKRAIRDLYTRDIGMIEIAGDEAYRQAKDFMRMLMPSHAKRVQPYRDPSIPLFFRYQVESQIDAIHNPVAHLKSGGYIVINQTEALVSIDVNSGRSTRERNIEETALKTNLEAADEIARQLRLRDMGGLIVVDFIDMDEPRHDGQVERRLKEAMKNDRARIQIGRMSPFGLLELSRQRLHPSLIETNFHVCPHCTGTGLVRSIESASLLVLRAIEEEGIKHRAAELAVTVAGRIALYMLNQKRGMLTAIEQRYGFSVRVLADDSLIPPEHRIERVRMKPPGAELPPPPANLTGVMEADDIAVDEEEEEDETESEERSTEQQAQGPREEGEGVRRRRRRRRRGRDGRPEERQGDETRSSEPQGETLGETQQGEFADDADDADESEEGEPRPQEFGAPRGEGEEQGEGGRRRRRGRRGGRNRSRRGEDGRTGSLPLEEGAFDSARPDIFADAAQDDTLLLTETEAIAAVVPSPASIPEPVATEVHDAIDLVAPTEPEQAEPAAPTVAAEVETVREEPPPPPAKDYEVVNQPPQAPRRGWWKRLSE